MKKLHDEVATIDDLSPTSRALMDVDLSEEEDNLLALMDEDTNCKQTTKGMKKSLKSSPIKENTTSILKKPSDIPSLVYPAPINRSKSPLPQNPSRKQLDKFLEDHIIVFNDEELIGLCKRQKLKLPKKFAAELQKKAEASGKTKEERIENKKMQRLRGCRRKLRKKRREMKREC